MSQQCDGNKDCDTGKDEANCTGSQQLISAKHEIAFRFIQNKCNFNVVTVVTLGLLMQLLDGYLLILATAVTKHLIVNHYDEADDNFRLVGHAHNFWYWMYLCDLQVFERRFLHNSKTQEGCGW